MQGCEDGKEYNGKGVEWNARIGSECKGEGTGEWKSARMQGYAGNERRGEQGNERMRECKDGKHGYYYPLFPGFDFPIPHFPLKLDTLYI